MRLVGVTLLLLLHLWPTAAAAVCAGRDGSARATGDLGCPQAATTDATGGGPYDSGPTPDAPASVLAPAGSPHTGCLYDTCAISTLAVLNVYPAPPQAGVNDDVARPFPEAPPPQEHTAPPIPPPNA